jgi:hypothetical protein
MVHIPLLVAVAHLGCTVGARAAAKALVDLMLLYGEPTRCWRRSWPRVAAERRRATATTCRPAAWRLRRRRSPRCSSARRLRGVSELRSVVVEGFAKLLFNNRVEPTSRGSLARLLFLLYEPGTALDAAVRQCLAVFVPAYAHTGPLHREALAAACAIALPALAACGENASVADCGGYLLSLLRDGGVDNRCVHADVARVVAEQSTRRADGGDCARSGAS